MTTVQATDNSLAITNEKALIFASLGLGGLFAYLFNKYVSKDSDFESQKNKLQSLQPEEEIKLNAGARSDARQQTQVKIFSQMNAELLEQNSQNKLIEELLAIDNHLSEIVPVPHLIKDLELSTFEGYITPLFTRKDGSAIPEQVFNHTNAFILWKAAFSQFISISNSQKWLRAGPRQILYFNPENVQALIITCGGLCPGLNVVIRELVMCLHFNYGATQIYGAKYGYQGIFQHPLQELTPEQVRHIHSLGGSFLGTSRGGFDLEKIIETLIQNGINQVYLVGGDGTLQGANVLYKEIQKRQLNIGVCGVPKTIDNDIPIIDESFGFNTGVEESVQVINAVYNEASSHQYGVGLVKLMGRSAGFIAMDASLAARIVNVCLIPEIPFDINGDHGVLNYVCERLKARQHIVLCVAEGAAEAAQDIKVDVIGVDKSGNQKISDIGEILRKEIPNYCKKKGFEATLKYIDPTYMIRAVPANSYDTKLCSQLAQNAIHGMMAGYTGFCIAHVNMKTCFIPFIEISSGLYDTQVTPTNRQWQRLLASTGQPSFLSERLDDSL